MSATTRDQFIAVAKRLFAERGFYGTSIAAIAEELGLTKQALLHHFGSKEKLYGEVLRELSEQLMLATGDITARQLDPAEQLVALVLLQYRRQMADQDAARLIMRELLDNEQRAEKGRVAGTSSPTSKPWWIRCWRLKRLPSSVDLAPWH